MGLFNTKKIKLEKIVKEDGTGYFIDYLKEKAPDQFFIKIIQDFTEEKNCLLVIDTDKLYERSREVRENIISDLKKELDSQEILYGEVITKKEADNKILGFKIQNSEKVNNYQIGVAVTQDQLEKVTELVKENNVFYFVGSEDMDKEQLLKLFYDVRGDYDELEKLTKMNIFNDYYFRRIRIYSQDDINSLVEMKLKKYIG